MKNLQEKKKIETTVIKITHLSNKLLLLLLLCTGEPGSSFPLPVDTAGR
jgi:hypothetical protein